MMKYIYLMIIFAMIVPGAVMAQTQEVVLSPVKDNSIYEEGVLSNGKGEHIFTGVIKTGERRRALLKFSLADAVPAGITIDSAALMLHPTKLKANGSHVQLHRLLADWGEGTSDAEGAEGQGIDASENDVTWEKAYSRNGPAWQTPGGDFMDDTSCVSSATLGSKTVFNSDGLLADIKHWQAFPGENHGWIVLGDETKSTTAIRFSSRENADESQWPDHTPGVAG